MVREQEQSYRFGYIKGIPELYIKGYQKYPEHDLNQYVEWINILWKESIIKIPYWFLKQNNQDLAKHNAIVKMTAKAFLILNSEKSTFWVPRKLAIIEVISDEIKRPYRW